MFRRECILAIQLLLPDTERIDLHYMKQLSDPHNSSSYHFDISFDNDRKITYNAILNPGHKTLEYKNQNFAMILITDVSD